MVEMERRPRIAAISHFFPTKEQPNRGLPLYHTMQALRADADVDMYCVDPDYPSARLFQPRSFQYDPPTGPVRSTELGVRPVRYPAFPLLSRPWNGASCARRLLPLLAPQPPDLILGYFAFPSGEAAIRLGRRLGVPVIVGVLGSDVRVVRGWTRRAVRRVLQRADYVIGVSRELCGQAVRLGADPSRIQAIPNGCDATVFRPAGRFQARAELGVDQQSDLTLFVGRLVPLKGLRELFAALESVLRTRPKVELACIGEGPLADELQARAGRDLAGRVRMLGALPPRTVARWLAAADLLCLPSHSEGCPNVVIEALAAGRPVVASEVGGIPELLDTDTGVLVRPRDAESLCRGILTVLGRDWDALAISASSRRTWDDVARETFAVCRQVLATGRETCLSEPCGRVC